MTPYWVGENEVPGDAVERTVRREYLTTDGRKFAILAKVTEGYETEMERNLALSSMLEADFGRYLEVFCKHNKIDPATVTPCAGAA